MDQTAIAGEITALEKQVTNLTAELDVITSTDPLDTERYAITKSNIDTAQTKLDAKKAELANLEDAAQAAQEELSAQLENISVGDFTVNLRALVADEDSYQLLYVWLQEREIEKAKVTATLKSSYDSQIAELRNVGIKVAAKYNEELAATRNEMFILKDKCDDLESKRDAAVAIVDEATAEIARLKADNENLRKQLEAGTTSPKETVEDAKAAVEKWKASRPAIYDVQPLDNLNKRFGAKLAANDDYIEFGFLEKNKYRVVTTEEVLQFRTAEAAANAVEEPAAEPEQPAAEEPAVSDPALGGGAGLLEPPVIDPPTEVLPGVQGTPAADSVVFDAEEATRRILALEARLDQLEG